MCLFLYFCVTGNRNLPDKQALQAQEVVQGEQAHFFYLINKYIYIFIKQQRKFLSIYIFYAEVTKKRRWQLKLATWLRVYNYVKNKHVRTEAAAC